MKKDDQDDVGSTSHGEYLYHQQLPEPQRRRLANKIRSSHPKPGEHKNAARNAMMTNIKTMGVVLTCMLILLFLAAYISRKTWDIKNQILTVPAENAEMEPEQSVMTPPSDPVEADEDTEDTEDTPTPKMQLDTETLRRAVFLSNEAKRLAESGDKQAAIEQYREALNVWPQLTDEWEHMGRLHLELKEFRKAQAALERALEKRPGSPEILNDLGLAHLFQKKVAQAQDLFTTVTEIEPSYAPTYFNIALCHLALKDQPAALEALEHYLGLKPDDPKALKEQAYLFANDQQYGKAMDSLKLALTHAPEWPSLYFDAAATAALMGRFEESLDYLDKAEVLTSPSTVYQIYSQPAFKEVRSSELGGLFEKKIADRARERLKKNLPAKVHIEDMTTEPSSSSTPTI